MAKIRFSNGKVVNFEGTPTPEDVDFVAKQLGITQDTTIPSQTKQSTPISSFATGAGKGVLSTARESSNLIGNIKFPDLVSSLQNPLQSAPIIAAKAVQKVSPLLGKVEKFVGREEGSLTKPEGFAEKAGFVSERVAEFLNPSVLGETATVIKTPLTRAAEKLYQSAMKPKDVYKDGKLVTKAADIVKTGLKERIWLTQGGVEKVANKIDDFEAQIGDAIDAAKEAGTKIKTQGVKEYLDEAKKMFEYAFDTDRAKKGVAEITRIGNEFVKKFGDEIPIEEAQKIKVQTGQYLRRHYNELSGAAQEAEKQGVRFLKDKIVEKAPVVGEVNARLKKLYEFDRALSKSSNRIKNLNLLGFGTNVAAGLGGSKAATVSVLTSLIDNPALKSAAGISLNELAKQSKKGVIPLNAFLTYLRTSLENEK